MKQYSIMGYPLVFVILLGLFSSVVSAGFDPTPFQPEINQLSSVVNQLDSIEHRLQTTLTLPADEDGLIDQLETMTDELDQLGHRVQEVQERLGMPPDPYKVCDALLSVQENTQDITDIANEFLASPPDPVTPGVLGALESLSMEALSLTNQLFEQHFKISLLSADPISVPDSVITYVMHGWTTGGPLSGTVDLPYWSEMTSEQQIEFLVTASFALTIDGVPVELARVQWYDQSTDEMNVAYYVAFPPYTFPEGDTFEFIGYWSIEFEGTEYTHTETRTVDPY